MKNWEFYEDQVRGYEPTEFAFIDGNFATCSYENCCRCEFRGKSGTCWEKRINFLYKEHKEPVVLTDDEKALCKLLGRGWIARDKNDTLWWYQDSPPTKQTNDGNTWHNIGGLCTMIHKLFPQCKFDFIKWEDDEPWEVKVDD